MYYYQYEQMLIEIDGLIGWVSERVQLLLCTADKFILIFLFFNMDKITDSKANNGVYKNVVIENEMLTLLYLS